jgi:hypothetical protein
MKFKNLSRKAKGRAAMDYVERLKETDEEASFTYGEVIAMLNIELEDDYTEDGQLIDKEE